jgi:hypothetical protein
LIDVEPGDEHVAKDVHESEVAKAKEESFAKGKEAGLAEKSSSKETAVERAKKAMKGLDENSKSLIEALISQTEKTLKASEESQKALAKEREEKINKEFEAKAKKFKIGVEGLGSVLKDVAANCSEESYKKLEAILTVAADKSSFEAQPGATNEEQAFDANGIYSQLEEKAKAAFPNSNTADAVTKYMVTPEGKDLYARFDKARQK